MLQTKILKSVPVIPKYRCVHEFSSGLPQTRINIFEVQTISNVGTIANCTWMDKLTLLWRHYIQLKCRFPKCWSLISTYEETINMSSFEDW